MKKLKFTLPLALLTFVIGISAPTSVYAVNTADEDSYVSKNFKDIGRTLRKLRREKNPKKIVSELQKIKKISNKNIELVPSFMSAGSKELDIYQQEINKMNTLIDDLIEKTNSGEIKSGAEVVKILGKFEDSAHQKIDLEH